MHTDMCIDMRMERCTHRCIDMCIDMRMNMCRYMCIDMCMDMSIDAGGVGITIL